MVAVDKTTWKQSFQKGMTLIELMIALTLGLLIMTALTALFVEVSRSTQEMAKTTSQIESARFAMKILTDDLQHAGFWGGFIPEWDDFTLDDAPSDAPDGLPDICANFSTQVGDLDNLLAIPVQLYNAVPSSCSSLLSNKVPGSDVLVVRHAGTCDYNFNGSAWAAGEWDDNDTNFISNPNCPAYSSAEAYFQVSRCEAEIDIGQRVQLSDDGNYFNNNASLQNRICDSAGGTVDTLERAPIYRYVQNIYYLRSCSVENNGNCIDNIPTLVRFEFDSSQNPPYSNAQPLVDGIEMLKFSPILDVLSDSGAAITDLNTTTSDPTTSDPYLDKIQWVDDEYRDSAINRGDGIPDTVKATCGASCNYEELAHIVGIRISLLARATQESTGYTNSKKYVVGSQLVDPSPDDGFKRNVYTKTVRLHNVSGRRVNP